MGRIFWYLFWMIGKSMVLTTVIVTVVVCLIYSQRYVDDIIGQSFSILLFFELVTMLLPYLVVMALPATLCFSVVFVYAKLLGDNELVVLRAAGVSHLRLAAPALILALIGGLFSVVMTLVVIPQSYERFTDIRQIISTGNIEISLPERTFAQPSSGLTVYYDERLPDGTMSNILVHDTRGGPQASTVLAERASIETVEGAVRIVFADGVVQSLGPDGQAMSSVEFDRYVLELTLLSGSGGLSALPPQAMPFAELRQALTTVSGDDPQRGELIAEVYRRFVIPLLPIAAVAISLATLFFGEQGRTGLSRRIALILAEISLLLVVFFWIAGMIGRAPAYAPLLVVAVVLPGVIGSLVLMQTNRRSPGTWRRRPAVVDQAEADPASV